jgi:hypothetical protein
MVCCLPAGGKGVQEGMQLDFADHSEEAAGCPDGDIIDTGGSSGSGDCVWQAGLDALSGGQRTLVSLS